MDDFFDDGFYDGDYFDEADYDITKVDNIYRKDEYKVGDTKTGKSYDFTEYFVVGGEHSIIRFIDIESGEFMIECYDKIVYYSMEDPTVEKLNAMRDAVMVYDFCVEHLRKLPKKQALKDPIGDLKYVIENEFMDTDSNFLIEYQQYLPKDVIQSLLDRCFYLTNALYAEWKGIIHPNRIGDFETVDQLDMFVENHQLLQKGEGIDKTIDEYKVFQDIREAYKNNDSDYMGFIRPYINDVLRIKAFKDDEKQLLEEEKNSRRYKKDAALCKSIICRAAKMQQKLELGTCKPFQEKRYEAKIDKLSDKIVKASVYGVFELLK